MEKEEKSNKEHITQSMMTEVSPKDTRANLDMPVAKTEPVVLNCGRCVYEETEAQIIMLFPAGGRADIVLEPKSISSYILPTVIPILSCPPVHPLASGHLTLLGDRVVLREGRLWTW